MVLKHIHPDKLSNLGGSRSTQKSIYDLYGKNKLSALRDIEAKFKILSDLDNVNTMESFHLKKLIYKEIEELIKDSIFAAVPTAVDVESIFINFVRNVIDQKEIDIDDINFMAQELDVSVERIINRFNLIEYPSDLG